MYTPRAFRDSDVASMHAFITEHSFALLVSAGASGLQATHLPVVLDPVRGQRGAIMAHMARANPHWRDLEQAGEVLWVFRGPHAYISPSFYEPDHNSVPTWNYAAVHAYGRVRMTDEASLRAHLDSMVTRYERGRPAPWSTAKLSEERIGNLLRGVVGFEVEITRLIGKRKLSQNRSPADQRGVIAGLEEADDADSAAVGKLMRELNNPG